MENKTKVNKTEFEKIDEAIEELQKAKASKFAPMRFYHYILADDLMTEARAIARAITKQEREDERRNKKQTA